MLYDLYKTGGNLFEQQDCRGGLIVLYDQNGGKTRSEMIGCASKTVLDLITVNLDFVT